MLGRAGADAGVERREDGAESRAAARGADVTHHVPDENRVRRAEPDAENERRSNQQRPRAAHREAGQSDADQHQARQEYLPVAEPIAEPAGDRTRQQDDNRQRGQVDALRP